jgi:PAS domain S-box-containing protein
VTEQLEVAAEREEVLLRERHARARVTTILESITDAFFALDREWRFTYVNREAERVLLKAREELLGRTLWEQFPEAIGTTFQREYHRAMAGQVTVNFEEFFRPLNAWFEVRAYPSPEGLSVYFHDVTERVRAAEALQESEGRFRAFAEHATAAIFVIDEDSTIEFANPAAERIFGYTATQMLGQALDRLMPEDQRPLHGAGMQRYLATGRRNLHWEGVELPGLTKDGRIIPLEISFGEFSRKGRRYFTGIARDISERKQAEQELRDSEERYRLLADMIPQHIWTTEADGYHSYFSRRWYDYTGATPEQTRGEGWFNLLHPADKERTLSRWQHSLRTGEPYAIEYRFRNARGDYCWFLGQAMPLRNEAGAIVRWFGTLTDISERKRLEEERERLLSAERDARAEAERQRDELERVTESRARLMRGFSHDVKNPLGAADGWARVLEDGVYGELPEKAKHNIGRIRRSIRHALEVIESLHELARTEAGEIPIKAEPVNLHELAKALVEEYRVTAETAALSLRIDTSGRVPPIQTDASRVRQILGNLLSNAIKYTDTGGVTVRPYLAATGPGGERRAHVKVDVRDTGPGISADQQERLFREFSRLNPGEKHGTGLGLAISQRLAHMLGGTITLQSEQGRGSTFTLWLPAAA